MVAALSAERPSGTDREFRCAPSNTPNTRRNRQKYENVRGYVNVRDIGDGNSNKTNIEFHLLP